MNGAGALVTRNHASNPSARAALWTRGGVDQRAPALPATESRCFTVNEPKARANDAGGVAKMTGAGQEPVLAGASRGE